MNPITTIDEFDAWLAGPGATTPEIWLLVARKGHEGLTADEAGDVAICHGWIDSHRKSHSTSHFRQRYSHRRAGSPWSQVNVARAEALESAGRMRAGGRAEIEAAKADGRWQSAYPSQATAGIPADLTAALATDPQAAAAFTALTRSARYALFLPMLKARTAQSRTSALTRALRTLRTR
ncbi:YdeI family protein [Dactylosporangium sp. NPDC051541]|uniref:YdeI family protein n=1 Tax=Dactylosporangium sp. NPDC051541 TaxID=3363977 RepID=UPI0037A11209